MLAVQARQHPALRPLNWDEKIDKVEDDENWVDPGAWSSGKSRPSNGNHNDNGEGEEDKQGGAKGTGKEKGANNGQGNGKGKGKGNGNGIGIVKSTPGGDDISCAIVLQLQKETYQANSDTEG